MDKLVKQCDHFIVRFMTPKRLKKKIFFLQSPAYAPIFWIYVWDVMYLKPTSIRAYAEGQKEKFENDPYQPDNYLISDF